MARLPEGTVVRAKVESLNLDKILGKPKNRVSCVGVELEGAWRELPPGIALERDGSVFGGARQIVGAPHVGELPLGPCQPGAIVKFMKKYYPHKVNETCGMHIHMSFENVLHYQWLMTQEYQETMVEYLSRWAKDEGFNPKHHIWGRLAGKSDFCQNKFWPDAQVAFNRKDHDRERDGHRYTIVHYCGRQMTIEIRVLPMMDTVEQAIRAVKMVILITSASLFLLGKKEQPERAKVILAENYEDYFDHEERL